MTRQLNPTKHSKHTINENEIFPLSFQTATLTPISAISASPPTNRSLAILKPWPSSNSSSHGEEPSMKKELLITIAFLTGFVAVVAIVGSLLLVIKCWVKSKKSRRSSK